MLIFKYGYDNSARNSSRYCRAILVFFVCSAPSDTLAKTLSLEEYMDGRVFAILIASARLSRSTMQKHFVIFA